MRMYMGKMGVVSLNQQSEGKYEKRIYSARRCRQRQHIDEDLVHIYI